MNGRTYRLGSLLCLSLVLGACAGDERPAATYSYYLVVKVDGSTDVELEVDGEVLPSEVSAAGSESIYERSFDDYDTAASSATVVTVRNGSEEVASLELPSAPCTPSTAPSCAASAIVRAEREVCIFPDGELELGCGRLVCFDEDGECGGFVE